jgi:hypothetical protein
MQGLLELGSIPQNAAALAKPAIESENHLAGISDTCSSLRSEADADGVEYLNGVSRSRP